MKRTLGMVFALALLAPPPVRAAGGADPYGFLFLDSNARAAAMGGAYTALGSGAGVLAYNPAGLAGAERNEVSFMHNQSFQGVTQDFLDYSSPRGWGASLNYLSFGDVKETTLAEPAGVGLGQTSLSDLALGLGYGRKLTEALSVGAGAKYIREVIDRTARDNASFDLGVLYAVPRLRGLSVGAALQNMGQTVSYDQAHENQPLTWRLGGAYRRDWLGASHALALDVVKERNGSAHVSLGVESMAFKAMALRLGYDQGNDAGVGMTAGVGWRRRDFGLDYAIVPFGPLGYSHRMSATFRWGGGRRGP
jgi:opacity protein-like surface antigen